jgi:hypothetical protein
MTTVVSCSSQKGMTTVGVSCSSQKLSSVVVKGMTIQYSGELTKLLTPHKLSLVVVKSMTTSVGSLSCCPHKLSLVVIPSIVSGK